MKRIISLIMITVLAFSCIPSALADENYGENLAMGKPVIFGKEYGGGFSATKATDGNIKSTAATASSPDAIRNGYDGYLIADLGGLYKLDRVIVRTRRDLDAAWARMGIMAVVATKADFSDAVELGSKDTGGEFGSDLNIGLKTPVIARYVMAVSSSKKGGIAIGEIEAYGSLYEQKVGGEFSDVEEITVQNAVKLVYNLGIMEGINDNEFGGPNLITRAEAVQIMCNFAKITPGEYSGEFKDVFSDTPNSGAISTGLQMGFISEAEYFRPDDYVTVAEFAKMILCNNGHYKRVNLNATYPQNVLSVAGEIDLFENCTADKLSYINRSDAAILMYNALLSHRLENKNNAYEESEESLMELLYDKKLKKGIVTGNGLSSLNGGVNSSYYERIEINNIYYSDESGVGINYLGENVYFITDSDESVIYMLWQNDKLTKKVTIYEYDIESADFSTIEKTDGNKTKRYRLEEKPYIVLNDAVYNDATEETLIPENGYLELIDNDNDNTYEIVKVYKPIIAYVNSVSFDEEMQTIAISDKHTKVLDAEYKIINVRKADGGLSSPDRITEGNLVYIYESANSTLINIDFQKSISNASVSGFDDNTIIIGDTEYEKTSYFTQNFANLEIGTVANYFIDCNDRLIYMTDESQLKATEFLAVIQNCTLSADDEAIETIRVFSSNGEFTTYPIGEKVSIDTNRKDRLELSYSERDFLRGKLAFITANNEGNIIRITTSACVGGGLEEKSISLSGAYKTNSGFYSGYKLIMPIVENLPIFTIPIDENGYPCRGAGFENFYSVSDVSKKYSNRQQIDDSNIKIYGVNKFNEPTAVVSTRVYGSNMMSIGTISSYSAIDALVFDSYKTNVNNDGEIFYSVIGYDLITGAKTTIKLIPGIEQAVNAFKIHNSEWYSDSVPSEKMPDKTWYKNAVKMLAAEKINEYFTVDIEDLKKGDILRYAKGNYEDISQLELVGENLTYDISRCKTVYAAGDLPDTAMCTFRLQNSFVKDISDGRIRFAYDTTPDNDEVLDLSAFSGCIIVVENNEITSYPITAAGIYLNSENRITVYCNAGYHKSIVVYK